MWEQTKGEIRDKRRKNGTWWHNSFKLCNESGGKKNWSQWIDCIHVFLINSLSKLHFSFSHLLVLETAGLKLPQLLSTE